MKEILKYLRQLHSFTQEEVAQRIGLSRQSYIKYERGVLQPNKKVVARLAELYRVPEDFIYKNEVPRLHPLGHSQEPEGQVQQEEAVYHIDPKYGQCMVADSGALPPTSPQTSNQTGGKEPRTPRERDSSWLKSVMAGRTRLSEGEGRGRGFNRS